jgi:hypothetical protein
MSDLAALISVLIAFLCWLFLSFNCRESLVYAMYDKQHRIHIVQQKVALSNCLHFKCQILTN